MKKLIQTIQNIFKIEELRKEYKSLTHDLAYAILKLADAQRCKSFASRDEVRWSDCTVHIMVFVDPRKASATSASPRLCVK